MAESGINVIGLSRKPVLLEPHRADVGQRRVQTVLLVPEQQAMTSSFAWRCVTNRCPCSRSTFMDPNSVSLQAFSFD